jgi:hypothetical protein
MHACWIYTYTCWVDTQYSTVIVKMLCTSLIHSACQNHAHACGIAVSKNKIQIFFGESYVNFCWSVLKSHAACLKNTCAYLNHTCVSKSHSWVSYSHSWMSKLHVEITCRNRTHLCVNHTRSWKSWAFLDFFLYCVSYVLQSY